MQEKPTRVWKLEQAKAQLSQLLRDAVQSPQVITRHGRPVAVVHGVDTSAKTHPATPSQAGVGSALNALRGTLDFSDLPDAELFGRDRGSDPRDLEL